MRELEETSAFQTLTIGMIVIRFLPIIGTLCRIRLVLSKAEQAIPLVNPAKRSSLFMRFEVGGILVRRFAMQAKFLKTPFGNSAPVGFFRRLYVRFDAINLLPPPPPSPSFFSSLFQQRDTKSPRARELSIR